MIQVTRFDTKKSFDAKGHHGMTAMRLQKRSVVNRANNVVQMPVVSP